MCIACHEKSAPVAGGYCRDCALTLRSEIEQGLRALTDYLRAWAAFSDWCARRGLPV